MTAEPTPGQEAICQACHKPIVYVGPYWDHPGDIKPRHIAMPQQEETQESDLPIEPHMAIRSVMFDLMARKADWEKRDDPNGVAQHIGQLITALKQSLKDLRDYNDLRRTLKRLKELL